MAEQRPDERALVRASRLLDRAGAAFSEGRSARALRLATEANALVSETLGPDDVNLAPGLVTLGRLHADAERADDAIAAYARAVTLLTPFLRDADALALALDARRGLAHELIARATYDEARVVIRDGLARCRGALNGTLAHAYLLNAAGMLGKYTGDYRRGLAAYREALTIVLAHARGGEDEAMLRHNLGGILHARGDYAEAAPHARRALKIRRSLQADDSVEVALERAALAPIVAELGARGRREALALYAQVLPIFRAGRRAYDVAVALHNRADLHVALGQGAERDYREALALKRATFGPAHPDTAMTMHNLGVYLLASKPYEARRLLTGALAIFETELGAMHPHAQATRARLAASGREPRVDRRA